MEITQFTIQNYRSFGKSAKPEEDRIAGLTKVNMIYGDNNSGKSNLLKFLYQIFSRKKSSETVMVEGEPVTRAKIGHFWYGAIENDPFIFHQNKKDDPIRFIVHVKIPDEDLEKHDAQLSKLLEKHYKAGSNHKYYSIYLDGVVRNYGDDYDSMIELNEVKLNGKVIYNDDEDIAFRDLEKTNELYNNKTVHESLLSIMDDMICFIDTDRFLRDEIYGNEHITLNSNSFKSWLHNLYLNPVNNNGFNKILRYIQESKIAQKNSVLKNFTPTFAKEKNNLELMLQNEENRFPISSFGTSVQQLIFLISSILENKSKILLIEELELNLSPKNQTELLAMLIELIEKNQITQVVFTTHSNYFDARSDFSIVQVEYDIEEKRSTAKKVESKSMAFFKRKTV